MATQAIRLVALVSVVGASLAAVSAAQAADHVKISYVVPTVQYGPLLNSVTEKGYFTQQGIDVGLVQRAAAWATPALIAGDLQFSGSPSVAISAGEGAHLKAIFFGSDHARRFEDLGAAADQDAGRFERVSRSASSVPGDTTEIGMRYILAQRNLPPADFIAYAFSTERTGCCAGLGQLSRR